MIFLMQVARHRPQSTDRVREHKNVRGVTLIVLWPQHILSSYNNLDYCNDFTRQIHRTRARCRAAQHVEVSRTAVERYLRSRWVMAVAGHSDVENSARGGRLARRGRH